MIDFDALKNSIATKMTSDLAGAEAAMVRTPIFQWLNSLSDEDLELVYEIRLNTDTAQYTLKDWQEALKYYKENTSLLDLKISVEQEGIASLNSAINESTSATGLAEESISALERRYKALEKTKELTACIPQTVSPLD